MSQKDQEVHNRKIRDFFCYAFAATVFGLIGGLMIYDKTMSDEDRAAMHARHAVADKAKADALAKQEEECLKDLECVVRERGRDAFVDCSPHVERLATTDFEWTGDQRFPAYDWRTKPSVVTFRGDGIKYQNGLGAWIRHAYECDFDVETKTVVNVRATPGRL